MNELQEFLDRMTDHHDVLNNHADVLEDHEIRLSKIEEVVNAPKPDAGDVAAAEAKVDEPEEGAEKETVKPEVEFKEEFKEEKTEDEDK